jgi:hypothetical protein
MVKASISVTKKSGPPVGYGDLGGMNVFVGIPARTRSRRGGKLNNAELLFIHTKGSPLKSIPARPVIEPAIEANQEFINKELGNAVSAALANDPEGVNAALNRAGMVAANACKAWFLDARNGWAPNKPATIRRKGSERPLIDTAAMRRAITHVVTGTFRKRSEPDEKEKQRSEEEPEEAPETKAARAQGEAAGESLAEDAAEAAEGLAETAEGIAEAGEFLL